MVCFERHDDVVQLSNANKLISNLVSGAADLAPGQEHGHTAELHCSTSPGFGASARPSIQFTPESMRSSGVARRTVE